jgi:NADH:ubiquinone oxidoreductase subunit 6 (subunit J)
VTTDSWVAVAFYVLATLMVLSALTVVLVPRVVHAALALVFFFFVIAGVYVLLQAEFIAATQVIIYVGAITVLFLFAIMLTHRSYAPDSNPDNLQWPAAALVALVTFGTLAFVLLRASFPTTTTDAPGGIANVTETLGRLLMSTFLVPFEIAGLLLLVAMIGAIVIARES